MTPIIVATAVAGSALQGWGMYQESKGAEHMADYNAKVQQQNAAAAEARAHEDIRRNRRQNKKALAKQRQAYADSGVLTDGTPLSVMAETASTMELEAQDRLWQGQVQSQQFQTSSDLYGTKAANISSARPWQTAGSILSGVNQTARMAL